MNNIRLYTAGKADFESIIRSGRIYVDKTDLIYRMTHESDYVFLSRPRRFGKSLLCNTLISYFQGHKEYFERLMLGQLETEWVAYPVLHFDLSLCKNKQDVKGIVSEISLQLSPYENVYGRNIEEITLGQRLAGLIQRAHKKTGQGAVVILDEYDAPLLDVLNKPDELNEVRRLMQELFQPLKVYEKDLRFTFITGITKFSHLSIFSTLNNLSNISMSERYSAICGFTEKELLTVFAPDIQMLADKEKCSFEEMYAKLKRKYDGYHFSENLEDIFNPYSLTKAFMDAKLGDYWFGSGTPTYLFEQMKRFGTRLEELDRDNLRVTAQGFDVPTEAMDSALPLLYQSGYLTIKDFDRITSIYTLDFPNAEVKVGFMDSFLKSNFAIARKGVDGFVSEMYYGMLNGDVGKLMMAIRSFFASIPYMDYGGEEVKTVARFEAFYETLFFAVFSMLNYLVFTQVKSVRGRCDVVCFMPETTYVMELKINGSSEEALRQINERGYSIPYETQNTKIVKIGINFSSKTRTVEDWKVETTEIVPNE